MNCVNSHVFLTNQKTNNQEKRKTMFLTEDKSLKDDLTIPGTTVLVGEQHEIEGLGISNKKDSDIILIPQPSKSPNDPLNWSYFRKMLHFIILFFFSMILAACSNFCGPIYTLLAEVYDASLNKLNTGKGLTFLFLAFSCLLCQPVSCKIGRRPIYLLSSLFIIIACIIFVTRTTYSGFIGYSVMAGIAVGPIDSMVEVSIADIFFLHDHGKFIGIYTLTLGLGSAFGPFLAGYITSDLGYLWCGYISIIICFGLLVVQFFFLEESYFTRKAEDTFELDEKLLQVVKSNRTMHTHTNTTDQNLLLSNEKSQVIVNEAPYSDSDKIDSVEQIDEPKTYLQRLYPFTVNDSKLSPFSIIKTLIVLRYPAVLWASVVYGIQICWLSLITVTQAQFFMAPPYNFSPDTLGLLNLAMVVGTLIGGLYSSFSDTFQIYMTKRNDGIFEPEFRLLMISIPVVLNVGGLLMYGLGPLYGASWVVGAIGIGLISIGLCSITSLSLTYVLECYPKQPNDTMTSVLFVRNLFATVFTWVFQYWLDGVGVLGTTIMLACFCFVISGSFIIMYWRGKTFRKYTMKWYLNTTE